MLRADPVEFQLLTGAFEHASRWQHERDQNLARMIVNEYAHALKRR